MKHKPKIVVIVELVAVSSPDVGLQMPADVSRGGIQLSRGLGNQSGERAERVGRGRGTVQDCSAWPDIFQIPRRGLLPLTSGFLRM